MMINDGCQMMMVMINDDSIDSLDCTENYDGHDDDRD